MLIVHYKKKTPLRKSNWDQQWMNIEYKIKLLHLKMIALAIN